MRPATLPLLLVLALLAIPLAERVGVPGGAVAPMTRGPVHREDTGSRLSAATAAAGMTRTESVVPGGAIAPMDRDPSDSRMTPEYELVTIIAPQPGAPPPPSRALTRPEAIANVMRSPDFVDTVPPLARLYFASFGRYPDYEGLNYYTGVRESGMTLAEIADDFARGREFEIRYGSLSNAEFVERLFVNVLGDPHQADVRGYWVSELDSGRMTRGQVIVDLSESGAFQERSANRVFVSTAYSEIHRSTPDANAYAHWVDMLDQGYPRRRLIDGLMSNR